MDRRSFLGLGLGAAALGTLPTELLGEISADNGKAGPIALGGPLAKADSPMLNKVKFTKLTINVGAKQPFKIIHCSDTHLNLMSVSDLLGAKREKDLKMFDYRLKEMQASIGGFAACVLKARLENVPLIHSGDVWDYHSEANFHMAADAFRAAGDTFYAMGNHEIRGHWEHEPNFNPDKVRVRCDRFLPNPSLYSTRVIGGVNFIAFDNCNSWGRSDLQKTIQERIKKEIAKGLPTVLVMHMPVCTPETRQWVLEKDHADPKNLRAYVYAVDGGEREFMNWMYKQPNFKTVLCGHFHYESQWKLTDRITQYVAGAAYRGNAYEIQFV